MSRHIQTVNPESRKLNNQSTKGKLIFTNIQGRAVAFLLCENILTWAQILSNKSPDRVGEIYIGKIKNVVPNINACFVEIANGEICYLSMKDTKNAFVLNRNIDILQIESDGYPKLVAGDEILVQIIRNAIKTKPAAVSCSIEMQNDYFVCKADKPSLCISSKIKKSKSEYILDILKQNEAEPSFCIIARTMCQELSDEALSAEYKTSLENFKALYTKARYRSCFSCIHSDSSPAKSILRHY